MNLYIMRHAEAENEAESGGDEARQLTERGRERTRAAANGLRRLKIRFDVVLTSPLPRAAETAELVAAAYANNPPPQVLPALSPGIAVRQALTAIAAFADHDQILIVGHEPQLSGLVALLLAPDGRAAIRLKKGGCVAVGVTKGCEPGGGELRWMLTQRHLRKLRKR